MTQKQENSAPKNENDPNPEQDESLEYESFSDELEPPQPQEKPAPANESNGDQARIAALEEALAQTKEQMMRTVAEAENGRKRALKEREDASRYAVSKFSKDLLSVADNLRRALEAVPADLLEQQPQIKNLTDGIAATERELLRSFEKNGIQKLEPLNEPFNPNFHEVMFEAPMPDKENGTIIQVIEPGYTLNGRILRPARVGVAKNESSAPSAPPAEPGQTIDTEA